MLPSLIQDVESGIEDCQDRLRRLGEARGTAHDQRLYLVRVGKTFSSPIKAAIDGVYAPTFFGECNDRSRLQQATASCDSESSVAGRRRHASQGPRMSHHR